MVNALTGNAPLIQALVASSSPPPTSASDASQSTSSRNAPDTVTISAAGQQAFQASQDMDHDGDSH
jgi:hypothetical protein